MTFRVVYGEPDVANLMLELLEKHQAGKLTKNGEKLLKKIVKALRFLSENPGHNSLNSHEISALSTKYGIKIFESYLENNTPRAGRIFWFYDPNVKGQIVFAGIEPHPEKSAYGRVSLSTSTPDNGE